MDFFQTGAARQDIEGALIDYIKFAKVRTAKISAGWRR
jgi:hypothetical protein